MKLKQVVYGFATYIPGVNEYFTTRRGTGGTNSARYCYSVWARHLVKARDGGLNTYPKTVAELGPGDSLGLGLAALISGSENYFAFDVVEYANIERNIQVFEELVELFKARVDIPGETEFPEVKPYLTNYNFPHDIFDESRLDYALQESRLQKIRNSIINPNSPDSLIQYKVPWFNPDVVRKDSVDLVYSQAVLEHVDALENAYKAMHLWLKPTGYISHQIDFRSHGTANEWNGHWAYSDFKWKLIRGGRPYIINREPHSTHLRILAEQGFKVICDRTQTSESKFAKSDLDPKYAYLTDEDLVTSGAFIQAVKQ